MASGDAADEDLEDEEEAISVEICAGKLSLKTNSASITTRSRFLVYAFVKSITLFSNFL